MSHSKTKLNTDYGKSGCKDAVWNKGKTIPGKNSKIYRKDPYGNQICY